MLDGNIISTDIAMEFIKANPENTTYELQIVTTFVELDEKPAEGIYEGGILHGTTIIQDFFVPVEVPASEKGGVPTAVGNTFSTLGFEAGSFETAYRMNAKQVLSYGRNIDGEIRSAATLTRANRMVSGAVARNLSKVGTGLAAISVGLTIYDGIYNEKGWQNHHTADVAISVAIYGTALAFPVVGWIVGGVYFVADVTSQVATGKSLTQNLFDPKEPKK